MPPPNPHPLPTGIKHVQLTNTGPTQQSCLPIVTLPCQKKWCNNPFCCQHFLPKRSRLPSPDASALTLYSKALLFDLRQTVPERNDLASSMFSCNFLKMSAWHLFFLPSCCLVDNDVKVRKIWYELPVNGIADTYTGWLLTPGDIALVRMLIASLKSKSSSLLPLFIRTRSCSSSSDDATEIVWSCCSCNAVLSTQ